MKTKLLTLLLLAGSTVFGATRFSVGVGIGAPAPVYYSYGPGYWVNGYYYPTGTYYYGGRYYYAGHWRHHREHERWEHQHGRR
jgi:hypothetical protein